MRGLFMQFINILYNINNCTYRFCNVCLVSSHYEGLILLGSYSTAEVTLPVLSIYGSEDGVMNREKYEKNKENLPSDFVEIIIEGGSHAYFGMYGNQNGDGKASITNEEQINKTTDLIITFIKGIAAQKTLQGKPAALCGPVFGNGFVRITRTRGIIPAACRKSGRNVLLIKANQG